MFKIGSSIDIHKLSKDRDLIIGGVKIDHDYGLVGHSDADVLTHTIIEAIIGALGLGDIGKHFPDNDKKYKDISSLELLNEVKVILDESKYKISNIDSIIIIEEPILKMYIPIMEENISKILGIDEDLVNIKATRGEGIGIVGRKEGVVASTTLLLYK